MHIEKGKFRNAQAFASQRRRHSTPQRESLALAWQFEWNEQF
jgi:Tfp pilus assembly protein PilF